MASPVTRIKLEQVGEETTHLALRPGRDWIADLELNPEGEIEAPVRIDLDLNRSGEDVLVTGRVEGRAIYSCYRCLEPAPAPLSGSFRVVYFPAPAELQGGRGNEAVAGAGDETAGEPNSGDEDVYYQAEGVIDLLPMLREQILVALPARALCRENCQGLCPSCGADLNVSSCECARQDGLSKFGKLRDLRNR